ncbi:helix-turn-helix transcriptional regulator [Amycolatopsis samaneae]|uniref:Helix-turn-helix domain-containing protein n=1 Tax=Amycolatopsis samaneae TaxID=664691 RepID=A0ABW5GFS5_9PSEU
MLTGVYQERPSRVPGAVVWSWTAAPAAGPKQVLPDGCVDILWRAGELLVAGPDTEARTVPASEGGGYAGLRFAPGTGPAVLGVPARELRNRRVPLAAIWPEREVRRLAGQLAEIADVRGGLEAAVLRRPGGLPAPDPVCAGAVAALARGGTIADVARAAGLSERQLHRRFLDAVGYGPKTLSRVLRLHRALELARAGTPLATVAALAGYADQPHLSREVKALAGRPVTELLV